MSERKVIGVIYRIDYKGNNPTIYNLSYGGSKMFTESKDWDRYYGSPSKSDCEKCKTWKIESKKNPHDFEKHVIEYVYSDESITEKEAQYLRSVSSDIVNDERWLNSAIPRANGFPEFRFTPEQMKLREEKRMQTLKETTGSELSRIFTDIEYRKQCTLEKYGVDHVSKLQHMREHVSKHRKEYFDSLTPEEKKQHGLKSLMNRKRENVMDGARRGGITKRNFSDEKKQDIETRRRAKWEKAVAEMTPEKKKEVSDRCKYASNFLRPLQYAYIEYKDSDIVYSDFAKLWKCKIDIDFLIKKFKDGNSSFFHDIVKNKYLRVIKIEKRVRSTFKDDVTFQQHLLADFQSQQVPSCKS